MNNRPEDFGYKLGMNIVPFINKCIRESGECYIGEGTHIFGRNDEEWQEGNIWSDSTIVWGWERHHDVKIIGAGREKTILRLIDNCHAQNLLGKPSDAILMVSTNWSESCSGNLIEGITFDGNYQNNNGNATIFGIRIRGEENVVRKCKFINFGSGSNNKLECFQIHITPITKFGKGSQIVDNYFTSPGRKSNSPTTHVAENTIIALGGVGSVIKDNVLENMDFDVVTQQSPLHGITIGDSRNTEIVGNKFINFQGICIYTDSWVNEDVLIKNNIAKNVFQFLQLTCQSKTLISFNKNTEVTQNEVELAIGDRYWHWNQKPIVSSFCGYIYDPVLDRDIHPGFENVLIHKNKVKLGYRKVDNSYEESVKLICYFGNPVGEDKIKMVDNEFISTLPKPPQSKPKKSWFKKIIEWLKKLFR